MMSNNSTTRAIAVEITHNHTGALSGVALIVPSERYVLSRADGEKRPIERTLTADVWREIDAWIEAGDGGLPARPAPLSSVVASALLEGAQPVTANRFTSIPLSVPEGELARLAERLLRELPGRRRSVA
jgi:hypothetical protein